VARLLILNFALADGTCGAFAANSTCDAPGLLEMVKERCEGKHECSLSARGTDWPAPSCAGPHRLFVQVRLWNVWSR
jgi:hypothetical protein